MTGVMATGEVVGSVVFTADELFRVEKLTVSTGPDLVDHSGLKVDKDGTWDVLARTGLTEEGVESIVTSANSLVTWHLSIRLHNSRSNQYVNTKRNSEKVRIQIRTKSIDTFYIIIKPTRVLVHRTNIVESTIASKHRSKRISNQL